MFLFQQRRQIRPTRQCEEAGVFAGWDGVAPFLDPLEPVSDEHLAAVARRANLSDAQRDQMVEQISATLGWNIRSGLSAG